IGKPTAGSGKVSLSFPCVCPAIFQHTAQLIKPTLARPREGSGRVRLVLGVSSLSSRCPTALATERRWSAETLDKRRGGLRRGLAALRPAGADAATRGGAAREYTTQFLKQAS
uniref:Uncharacterized protein n=1 Tax=Leersia perrieri TaxID=77586 RepID=A0A0D9VY95_9ORYZ